MTGAAGRRGGLPAVDRRRRALPAPRAVDVGAALLDPGAALVSPRFPAARPIAGRRRELAWLAETLAQSGQALITEAPRADGQGGLGKSALALAHARAEAGRYPGGVLRLGLADGDALTVATELAACAVRLELGVSGSLAARLRALETALAEGPARLMILDDCPDAAALRTWRPDSAAVTLLATARRAPWSAGLGLPELPLQAFDMADGLDLLARHRPDLPPADPGLSRIAEALNRIPEALSLAAHTLAYIRQRRGATPESYLQALQAVNPDAWRLALGPTPRPPAGRERAVMAALACALGELDPRHGPDILALAILRLACAFRPDTEIPDWLLRRCAAAWEGPPDNDQIAEGLRRLAALGLLHRPGKGRPLTVSRLVAAVVAAEAPDRTADARRLCEGVAARTAQLAAREGRIDDLLCWQRQLRHLGVVAESAGSRYAGVLLAALAGLMLQLDEPDEAAWLADRAAAVNARTGGPRPIVPTPDPRSPAEISRLRHRTAGEARRLDRRIDGDAGG